MDKVSDSSVTFNLKKSKSFYFMCIMQKCRLSFMYRCYKTLIKKLLYPFIKVILCINCKSSFIMLYYSLHLSVFIPPSSFFGSFVITTFYVIFFCGGKKKVLETSDENSLMNEWSCFFYHLWLINYWYKVFESRRLQTVNASRYFS